MTDQPSFGSSHMSSITRWWIANFQFQRPEPFWQTVSQLFQISVDRQCRLTARLQNKMHKIRNKIFENIFEIEEH